MTVSEDVSDSSNISLPDGIRNSNEVKLAVRYEVYEVLLILRSQNRNVLLLSTGKLKVLKAPKSPSSLHLALDLILKQYKNNEELQYRSLVQEGLSSHHRGRVHRLV